MNSSIKRSDSVGAGVQNTFGVMFGNNVGVANNGARRTGTEFDCINTLAGEIDGTSLPRRVVTYGPFKFKEIAFNVVRQCLIPKERINLLSISTSFRELAGNPVDRLRVVLTPTELLDVNNEKRKFAEDNKLKLKIRLTTNDDIHILTKLIQNSAIADLLNHCEAVTFEKYITGKNKVQIESLLKLMGSKCPNLTSFSCKDLDMGATFTLPIELKNLISFSCEVINMNASLTIPKELFNNLISFSCGSLHRGVILTLPEKLNNLTYFSCGYIRDNAILTFPKELNNLIFFSCGHIDHNKTLTLPKKLNNLTSFSCGSMGCDVILTLPEELNNLVSFSCGNINKNEILTLPKQLDNLEYITCAGVHLSSQIVFPEHLPKLNRINFKKEDVQNPDTLRILNKFRCEINSRIFSKLKTQLINRKVSSQSNSNHSSLQLNVITPFIESNVPIAKGLLEHKDIARHITKRFLSYKDTLSLLSVNTQFRVLASDLLRAVLTPIELIDPYSEKSQFIQKYKLKFTIQLKTDDDIAMMTEFIQNSEIADLLNHLEGVHLGNISPMDKIQIENLLKLMGSQCPNLTLLSLQQILRETILSLPKELNNLRSFSCGDICATATLKFSEEFNNLTSFSCRDIALEANLTISKELKNLTSFVCGKIYKNAVLTFPEELKNLTSFVCGGILNSAILILRTKLPNLTFFVCGDIDPYAILELPEKLNKLTSFSCNIWNRAVVRLPKELNNLETLTVGFVKVSSEIIIPSSLPKLKLIKFEEREIQNADILESLQNLRAQIDARASEAESSKR